MSEPFDAALGRHEQLLEVTRDLADRRTQPAAMETDERPRWVDEARDFLEQVGEAGRHTANPQKRAQLRAILRFWQERIYDATGEMPRTELMVAREAETTHDVSTEQALGGLEEDEQAIETASAATGISLIRWVVLALGAIAVGLTLWWAIIRPAPFVAVSLEQPPSGQFIYCVPGQSCLTHLAGTLRRGLMPRENLGVLPLVQSPQGPWYPQENVDLFPETGAWSATAQLGDWVHPPQDGDLYRLVAVAMDRVLILGIRRLGAVESYEAVDPVAATQPISVVVQTRLVDDIAPQLADVGASDFAFPVNSQDYFVVKGEPDSAQEPPVSVHLQFVGEDGQYAGWSVALPRGAVFDGTRYQALRIWIETDQKELNAEIKLEDAGIGEASLLLQEYVLAEPSGRGCTIPLSDFITRTDVLDLSRLKVLTFGFNAELGNADLTIRRITFE